MAVTVMSPAVIDSGFRRNDGRKVGMTGWGAVGMTVEKSEWRLECCRNGGYGDGAGKHRFRLAPE